jgi:lysophospholipase L1-like esterase
MLISALVVASTGAALLVAELGVRVFQRATLGTPLTGDVAPHVYLDGRALVRFSSVRDHLLGWRPTPDLFFEGLGQRVDGSEYPLRVTQNADGFRAFGAPATTDPKILFVGDSFTQGVEVSDDQTFYAELSRQLEIEVFAFASRGYGTLQESLAIDSVFDRIQPDAIVWQFCMNDFMANDYELERSWTASAMGMPRPYWNDGAIHRSTPESFGWLLDLAGGSSRLLYLVTMRYERLLFVLDGRRDVLIEEIRERGLDHPGFRAAVEKTREVLSRALQRVEGSPVVVFEACTTDAPFHPVVAELARDVGAHFVADLPAAIEQAASQGQVVYALDGVHWSPEGHQVVAGVLRGTLLELGLAAPR